MKYDFGQIIRFVYVHKVKDEDTGDKNKEILVLHPSYKGKIHAIDLKRLSPAERKVLQVIMDPESRGKTHRLALVNDILRRMDPTQEIKDPQRFYVSFVKPFLRGKDAYRQYWPSQIMLPKLVEDINIDGTPKNPRPLFNDKPKPTEKTTTAKPKPLRQEPKSPPPKSPAELKQRMKDSMRVAWEKVYGKGSWKDPDK